MYASVAVAAVVAAAVFAVVAAVVAVVAELSVYATLLGGPGLLKVDHDFIAHLKVC